MIGLQKKANQLELSKQKPSIPTEPATPAIPFQFTTKAKESLKTVMDDEHLKEHEDNPRLRCHKIRWKDTLKKTEEITRTKLYALIYMGLNHIESGIQLGDLTRFLREGHITLQVTSTVSNDARYNLDFSNRIQRGLTNMPRHATLRTTATDLANEIGFRFRDVDLSALCHRYLQELCLPPQIGHIIDMILHACPPTMGEGNHLKNYEARAMAFILFVLKLLFGLDDTREYSIASSCRDTNRKISELNANREYSMHRKELFVWTDWVEYIEMRSIILTELHYPTTMRTYLHGDGITKMYLEYLNKTDEKNADARSTFKPYAKLMHRVRDFIRSTFNVEPKVNEKISYYPTLTPERSYMEEVQCSDQSEILVPTFMNVAHDELDIEPFLSPTQLQSFFRSHKIKLNVKKLKCEAEIDALNADTKANDFDLLDHRFGTYCFYNFDVSTEEWLKHLQTRKSSTDVNEVQKEDAAYTVERRLEIIEKHNRVGKAKKKAACRADVDEDNTHVFDCFSSDDDDEDCDVQYDETLELSISNSDYWLLFNSIQSNRIEFKDFRKNLAKSFQWLLKKCADLIENQEMELYLELMVVEYYFTKDVKPSNAMYDTILNRIRTICKNSVCNKY